MKKTFIVCFLANEAKKSDEKAIPARKEVIPMVIAQLVSVKKKKRILVL